MTKQSQVLLLCGLIMLGFGVSHASGQEEITDSTGVAVKLLPVPERIVCLAPSVTEQVFSLGCGDKVVGVTVFCTFPPEAQEKEKVGTLLAANAEKILLLKPDLVIGTKEGNRPDTPFKLRRLGLRVFVLKEAPDFDGICESFLTISRLLGRPQKGTDMIGELKKELSETRARTSRLEPVKVFCQLGAAPLFTAASGTFTHEIITAAGGINTAAGAGGRYPQFSYEEVIRQDPAVILISGMGQAPGKEADSWKRFGNIRAVREGRLYAMEERLLCTPTPAAFIEGVRKVSELLGLKGDTIYRPERRE